VALFLKHFLVVKLKVLENNGGGTIFLGKKGILPYVP
jgi:hypothetical protein